VNYIMHRSFAETMGVKWPKEIAFVENGKPVTYAQLLTERKKRQAEHLSRVLDIQPPRRIAAYVWVFLCPGIGGFAFYGYWLYIRALGKDWWIDGRSWFRESEHGRNFTLDLMGQFPCGLLPIFENFDRWKEAFAKTYSRPGRFKKQGLVLGWVELGSNGWPVSFTPAQLPRSEVIAGRDPAIVPTEQGTSKPKENCAPLKGSS
jgi:hypothetical protein